MRELADYAEELSVDFRTHYNVSFFEAGDTYTWQEALLLVRGLAKNEQSRYRQELLGYTYNAPLWAQNIIVLLGSLARLKKKDIHTILPRREKRKRRVKEREISINETMRFLRDNGIVEDMEIIEASIV